MSILSFAAFVPSATAGNGNDTWLGNSDNNWSTAANWSPAANTPPTNGDWLVFGAAGTSGGSLNNNLFATNAYAGITFNSGASGFTFSGNPINLAGGITNNSTVAQVVSLQITNPSVSTLVTTPGGGNLTLNGGITGAGGLTLIGGGTLTMGGVNSYSGVTTVNAGTLTFTGNNVMPTYSTIIPNNAGTIIDLAGSSQSVGPVQSSVSSGSGVWITNSAAGQSVLTINAVTATGGGVNDFQYNSGIFGGNLKVVIVGNGINANYGGANAFQFSVAGSSIQGGLVLQGYGTAGLSAANLLAAGGYIISGSGSCTNTSSIRINNGISLTTPLITLDNGLIWTTAANNVTNPILVTARGGIIRMENNGSQYSGSISGSGFLGLDSSQQTFTLGGDLSGFTGTFGVDCGSGNGVGTLNINSNSPAAACNLLFWGNGGKNGTVQWNGSIASPVTLTFAEASSTSVAGSSTAIGHLSSGVAATVTYQIGDNTANTPVFGGIVQNGSGTVGVTKVGTDTQTLSGVNAYSGLTAVNGGTLILSGVNNGGGGYAVANSAVLSLGGTGSLTNSTAAVTVSAGGTLVGGGGTVNGLVTLNSGNAAITLQDNVADTLTLAGGLTLNNGNTLSFDVGDTIAITGGTYTKNTGTVTVNVIGSVSPNTTYNLITGASITSTNGFILGATPSVPNYSFTLVATGGNLALQAIYTAPSPANAYWKGGVNNNWSAADSGGLFNWSTNSGGTLTTGTKPGAPTAVTFSATGAANQSTVLGGDFEIASLAITASGNIGIGGANSLQLDSGGLSVNSGAGNLTISNNSLVLGATQLWTNNSVNTVTVSASISGLGAVTLGGGNNVWSGANSHGGTTLSAGKLTLTGAGTLGSVTAPVSVLGGAVDLGGSAQTNGAISLQNGSAITNGMLLGTSFDLQSGTISASIGGSASASAIKSTANTVVLSANNTYAGSVVVSNGTLQIGAGGVTGSLSEGSITINTNATLVFNSSGSQTNIGQLSGAGAILNTGGGSVRLTSQLSPFSGSILVDGATLVASGGNNTVNAPYGPLGSSTASRSITLTNGGTLILLGGNVLGSGVSTVCHVTNVINQGCQLILNANDANILSDLYLNGGSISVGNGFNTAFQGAILLGSVTIGGSIPSTIAATGSDAARDGAMLGAFNTDVNNSIGSLVNFNVNPTGSTNPDLTVSTSLVDPPYSTSVGGGVSGSGGFNKLGNGTMLLATNNRFTGPTVVQAGKLVVNSAQGANGMTNTVGVYDGAALGLVVSGAGQWSPSIALLGQGGSTTLEFTGVSSTSVAPLAPGTFTVNGSTTVNVLSCANSTGTYPLVSNWDMSGTVALGTLPANILVATLDTTTSTIKLVVTQVSGPSTTPFFVTNSVSGGNLSLTWPSDHKGFRLQVQTNSLSTGLGTNWTDWPGATATNSVQIPIGQNNGSVFFRLVYP